MYHKGIGFPYNIYEHNDNGITPIKSIDYIIKNVTKSNDFVQILVYKFIPYALYFMVENKE